MSDSVPTEYLIPAVAYHEPAWFEVEQKQLFERAWAFAGVEHDLAKPGDFVTVQVGRASIVVVRGSDGELNAFHNVCRHRGVALVDGEGSCGKALVCPYHRWSYGLDGALRSVAQKEHYADLDFDQLGLHRVRCETWKTLVFVHLDQQAEPLVTWMAGLGDAFPNFRPEELVEISDQRHDVAANWKLYIENHVDWLHLWYLHDESLGMYEHAKGERTEYGRHWTSFEWGPESAEEADVDDSTLLPIANLDHRESTNGAHLIFPALTLFTNQGYWMLGQVIPIDPGNLQLRLRVFALEGSDGPAFEDIVNVVMFEDYAVAESIQRNIASPAFEVGPLTSDYEHQIMRFHQHYLDHVEIDHVSLGNVEPSV